MQNIIHKSNGAAATPLPRAFENGGKSISSITVAKASQLVTGSSLDPKITMVPSNISMGPPSATMTAQISPLPHTPHTAVTNVRKNQTLLAKEADIAKCVLDNPSKEAVATLKGKYNQLSHMFADYNITEEDLEYMLWATPEARCGFSKHYCPDKPARLAKMKAFLIDLKSGNIEKNISKENFAQRVGEFEGILTSMAYRSIGPSWVNDDIDKQTGMPILRSYNVGNMCGEVGYFLAAGIGSDEFRKRGEEDTDGINPLTQRPKKETIPSQKISGIRQKSFIEDGKLIRGREGLKDKNFSDTSFVGKSMNNNFAMRAHVSGSAPLSSAAFNFLDHYEKSRNGASWDIPSTISKEDDLWFKGILVATYSLGDFHSFTETTYGSSHFSQQKVYGKDGWVFRRHWTDRLENVPARNMLGMGVGALMGIVSEEPEVQDEFNGLVTDLLSNIKTEKKYSKETLQKKIQNLTNLMNSAASRGDYMEEQNYKLELQKLQFFPDAITTEERNVLFRRRKRALQHIASPLGNILMNPEASKFIVSKVNDKDKASSLDLLKQDKHLLLNVKNPFDSWEEYEVAALMDVAENRQLTRDEMQHLQRDLQVLNIDSVNLNLIGPVEN